MKQPTGHSILLCCQKRQFFVADLNGLLAHHFGRVVIEEIARLVIPAHIQGLRNGQRSGWNTTVAALRALPLSGTATPVRIISDLWWQKDGINNYISLKTVKPNIDQTAIVKEDCLRLTLSDTYCNAYFGLLYNPYGENKNDYAHTQSMGIFDFHHDTVVLTGKEMWGYN